MTPHSQATRSTRGSAVRRIFHPCSRSGRTARIARTHLVLCHIRVAASRLMATPRPCLSGGCLMGAGGYFSPCGGIRMVG
eukprot:CAMPEP_0118979658 /NCGR_PEP_ID=MMETSP1173-20130426/26470_1 /TAXON_ID=1034831 /ORGANISM="Rhizochromulina marina cf, Strain CCMP1243" /LENGTH=79 /DNA_ID=CAMNT_0006929931 /DNA_START=284 /DNA_END=520 /DNA_ORIENTATION=+